MSYSELAKRLFEVQLENQYIATKTAVEEALELSQEAEESWQSKSRVRATYLDSIRDQFPAEARAATEKVEETTGRTHLEAALAQKTTLKDIMHGRRGQSEAIECYKRVIARLELEWKDFEAATERRDESAERATDLKRLGKMLGGDSDTRKVEGSKLRNVVNANSETDAETVEWEWWEKDWMSGLETAEEEEG
jgi:hypothetical protein